MFKRREENLRKKDLELQEALVLFNKFLKENEAKRKRADKRAEDEIQQRLEKEKRIEGKQQQLQRLNRRCEKLKHLVSQSKSSVCVCACV
jgi:CFAP73 family protein